MLEQQKNARARLSLAKDAWTRCAVSVLRREPGAGDALTRQAIEEASA